MTQAETEPLVAPGLPSEPVSLACPECQEQGLVTTFETPQGLAAHRRRVHNVEGTSQRTQTRRESEARQEQSLVCTDCDPPREFPSAQALANHRGVTHGSSTARADHERAKRATDAGFEVTESGEIVCPECKAAGEENPASFRTRQQLASHRSAKHGVRRNGRSKTDANKRTQVDAPRKRRSGSTAPVPPIRRNQPSATGVVPPSGLSPREFAAYRLGVLHMMFNAVEQEAMEPPAPMFLEMFKSEAAERERQLVSEGQD